MTFEEIYNLYSKNIFRVCMGYVNDYEKAKDLTQETFIAVWEHLPAFRNQSAISTWLFRIATNNCLRAIEKSKRIQSADTFIDIPDNPHETPNDKVKALYKCISTLAEGERIIIMLVLEDIPQAEIATIVGLSEGNIRVKIHRIKQKLTKQMKAYGEFQ